MWIDQRGSEVLAEAECHQLLAMAAKEGAIGRLAVSGEGAPIVVPVNFAVQDHQILIRVGSGRLADLAIGHLVAFEIDECDPSSGYAWSVLLRGLASTVIATAMKDSSQLPHPLVHSPGDTVLTVRPDVVSGRRFSLQAESNNHSD
jgi:nitroimidazol reductase NimA-like FMN-containing flavoprotein (pyridoxamine 5'-phosphate oxidase superfamily)